MGTWISHLRIAEALLPHLPGVDPGSFAYGNLAPDSGIPNADGSQFDPPKEVTHFLTPGEGEGRCRDLEFYRAYLAGLDPTADRLRYSFALGYFFHLLCDNLWAIRVGRRFKEDYAPLFAAQGSRIRWELKNDWYDLDFRYLRDHPASLFWTTFLPALEPPAYLPFIPPAALRHQMRDIKAFYTGPPERPLDRVYPYLNEAAMTRYVRDSTAALVRIHAALQEKMPPPDWPSALALLRAEESAAYDSPLGDRTPALLVIDWQEQPQ